MRTPGCGRAGHGGLAAVTTAATAAVIALAALLAGCGHLRQEGPQAAPSAVATPVPAGSSTHAIAVGGVTRSYIVYRPAALPAAAPLVVMLHGGFGSASQ